MLGRTPVRFITAAGDMAQVEELAEAAELASSEKPINRKVVGQATSGEWHIDNDDKLQDDESEQDRKDDCDAETQRTKSEYNFKDNSEVSREVQANLLAAMHNQQQEARGPHRLNT